MSSAKAASHRLVTASVTLLDLEHNLQIHFLAHEGALAGVARYGISGEEVRGYFEPVTANYERLSSQLDTIKDHLGPAARYVYHSLPARDRKAVKS